MNIHDIIWILIASALAVIPVFLIKKYNKTRNYIWIVLSMFFFLILSIAYSKLFFNKNIIIIYPIIKVVCILIVTIVGYLFFDYKLNFKSYIGILFAIISICLLSSSI
jgi:multidrug transporter EmrE-like cation transporter